MPREGGNVLCEEALKVKSAPIYDEGYEGLIGSGYRLAQPGAASLLRLVAGR
jgi:hypothetical protein